MKGCDYMLNYINLVGRLVRKPEVHETEEGKSVSTITLAVPRSFKNVDGVYDTDFIDCTCFNNVAINTAEYCNAGDVICVKGRVVSKTIEENDIKKNKMEVIAEKVTFLATKKVKEHEEEKEMY